jgi:hypothetical protein
MRRLPLPALLVALIGYWLPWLTHPRAAALRLNAYELSEWITFLPAVRSGEAALSRLAFLFPLACLALLCALVAIRPPSQLLLPPLGSGPRVVRPSRRGLLALLPAVPGLGGWALLLAGLLCAFVVFPPYPYLLTAHADPEYRWQLVLAILTVAAFVVVAYLPRELNALLLFLLAVAAIVVAVPAMLALRPQAHSVLNAVWPLGVGWPLLLLGLGLLALGGLARLFGPRE